MNSSGLQQDFILFLENKKELKETPRSLKERLCCAKCRFSTKDAARFERHVAQHEEVTFTCTMCNHISYSRVESQRHLVTHKGSFPYKCSWCSYGAVRRDYMVKHIQRIHGKSPDGIIAIQKLEWAEGRFLPAPRTLTGPSHGTNVVSQSAGTVSSCHYSADQTRPSAPYCVTSTACGLPIIKPPQYIVPSNSPPVCKVAQGLVNPPNVTAKAMEYVTRKDVDNTAVSSGLPRVHYGISGNRLVQQKPPLQSQVVGSTEKTETKTSKIQVGLPVSNNNHAKTLLGNQHQVQVAQRPVSSGAVQNIPVAHVPVVQRSVPSSSNPTIPAERFRQGILSAKHVAQTSGKSKTRPNILVRTPAKAVNLSAKPGGDVGLVARSNLPIPHDRPLTESCPEERNPPRSSIQGELLTPVNQPIQHNKSLTVSCPEEITIPAGCLVELVEVKTVNGARELELRLVPQQLPRPQPKDVKSTHVTSTSRLSFKCKVTTEDKQPANTNNKMAALKANPIPEPLVQQPQLKKLLEQGKVKVKTETEVNETPAAAPSSKVFHAVSRSVPSASHNFAQQLCAEQKGATTKSATSLSTVRCTINNVSPHPSNKKNTTNLLKYQLTAAHPPANKQNDAELGYQGLPVISSVFSLCPIPQDTLRQGQSREEEAQKSKVSGLKYKQLNGAVCKPAVKTEDEIGLLTNSVQIADQLPVEKDEILEKPKAPEDAVKENLDAGVEKIFTKHEEDMSLSQPCSSSTDPLQTHPSVSINSSSVSKRDNSTHPERTDETLESKKSLLTKNADSNMNPVVALIRMPSLEFFSLSEFANKEVRDGEESVTARPVVCCTPNQQHVQERTIKLVLKRKPSETKTAEDTGIDLVCVGLPPTNKKAKKGKRRDKKDQLTKDKPLSGKSRMEEMYLTPLKEDQLVKHPGPDQPVVVLNHPNPLAQMVGREGQTLNNQHCRNSTPGICNQNGTILSNPVRTCPAFKMTLKKVQGRMYQVTELLLKGLSEITVP